MKKEPSFSRYIILFVMCLFLLNVVSAQADLQQLQQSGEKAVGVGQQLTSSGTSSSYLSEQWAKFFTETELGKQIATYLDYPKVLDPVFKFFLGIEFSWSALFFVTVFLWWLIRNYFGRLIDLTGRLSKKVRIFLSILATIFVSFAGLTRGLASLLVGAVSIVTGLYQVFLWLALFILWIYLMRISKDLHKLFRKAEKESEQKKEIENMKRDIIQARTGNRPSS